jgi:SnoaL-like domain
MVTRTRGAADTGRVMSRENVELTHRAIDAFNQRDLDAFLALMDADVEFIALEVEMEGGYHGHAGMRRWWGSLVDVSLTSPSRSSKCATSEP